MRWALRASRTSPPLACVSIAAAPRPTVAAPALQHRWAMRQASSSSTSMTTAAASSST